MFQIAQNFGPFDFQFDFQFDFHKRKCIDLPQYVTDQSSAHCLAQSFNHYFSLEKKPGFGTNMHVPN